MGERRDRVRLAWNVLRGRPTMYRIRISEAGVTGRPGFGKPAVYQNEISGCGLDQQADYWYPWEEVTRD